ncbi:C6 finger domain protein, putative [Cordyceps militaris CM01]|uniref:C6 finger domain protein, putative n=1 Tax=Cordyceps militaris (strain CM01) TaxID=983644 RepID=G3JKL1_CORMM|nr:C6 finger domain protein, putative [Cordyceps militaris CM01]EGX91450.1 C6 finger domain protein, putative [Cordyceps militaris CM01]
MTSMSPINTAGAVCAPPSHSGSVSPRQPLPPKNVAFELLFLDSPQYRARLPMRVQIYPHDTTDSIVTTVKNFYGLYSGRTGSKGVSFEDDQGNTLIARYENFTNNMIVYVRVIEEAPAAATVFPQSEYQSPTTADAYYEGDQYARNHQNGGEAPNGRASRQRSQSPRAGAASRSGSVSSKKSRSRSVKSHATNVLHGDSYAASVDGYSSGDGEQGSVSGRSKEQLGTTDISVENIVEGGRRKRAKFESSELPLFAPPQMPAATSNPSVSPARRIDSRAPLSYVPQGTNPFTNPRSLHASQNYGNGFQSGVYATPTTESRRHHRGSISYGSSGAMGIMPTPDPTVGSCMSEEDKDVAIQLMRLGEMSNISHGRTSASTLDDTFSGRADNASSTGATSDGESESDNELPAARRQKLDMSGASKLIYPTTESSLTHAQAEYSSDEGDHEAGKSGQAMAKPPTTHKPTLPMSKPPPKPKMHKPSNSLKMKKPPVLTNVPMSPASAPHSRKPSVASINGLPTGGDDDNPDLSTKPRCQRCRKSKKGCDRQRPCGRCRDAGLSADQCISEDEGNGRKGRYGRHMGVPIKHSADVPVAVQPTLLPAAPIAPTMALAIDKNKKRKR